MIFREEHLNLNPIFDIQGGTEATKTPDKKTPGGSSVDDDVENKENNDGASISEAQEVFESNLGNTSLQKIFTFRLSFNNYDYIEVGSYNE